MPGKEKGTKNYKKDILLEMVRRVRPTSADMWQKVCRNYQSGDMTDREPEDVKIFLGKHV